MPLPVLPSEPIDEDDLAERLITVIAEADQPMSLIELLRAEPRGHSITLSRLRKLLGLYVSIGCLVRSDDGVTQRWSLG